MRSWGLIEWRKWRKPCCSASAFDLLFNWSSDFTVKDDFIEIPSGRPLNAYATMDARRQRPDAQTKAPTHMSFLRHPQVQRACALSSFQMTSSRKRDSWEKRTNEVYVRREEQQRRTLRKGKSDVFKSHKKSLHLQHTQKWGHVEGRLNRSFCLHAKYYVSPQSRTLGDTQKEGRQPLKQMIFFTIQTQLKLRVKKWSKNFVKEGFHISSSYLYICFPRQHQQCSPTIICLLMPLPAFILSQNTLWSGDESAWITAAMKIFSRNAL